MAIAILILEPEVNIFGWDRTLVYKTNIMLCQGRLEMSDGTKVQLSFFFFQSEPDWVQKRITERDPNSTGVQFLMSELKLSS